MSSKTYH